MIDKERILNIEILLDTLFDPSSCSEDVISALLELKQEGLTAEDIILLQSILYNRIEEKQNKI